ncbi:Protein of unknown function [Cotesia congregata]|uniref:Uncharacterized protein n=1 Tax=Cotesia congregata TaxID=51543 RepID=A0A8J2HP31_COTCN|nr:Protein of unknown function [Cotesia congregata]
MSTIQYHKCAESYVDSYCVLKLGSRDMIRFFISFTGREFLNPSIEHTHLWNINCSFMVADSYRMSVRQLSKLFFQPEASVDNFGKEFQKELNRLDKNTASNTI